MPTIQTIQTLTIGTCIALTAGLSACTEDPRYVQPDQAIEAGGPAADPEMPATAQIVLPIRLETEAEAMDRAELAAELGIEIPYVQIADLEISLEWSIRNLSEEDATVFIQVNGANEFFAYVPSSFVVDPEEEAEPPPLAGNVPISIPALGSIGGVFREDQLREASTDLELITRGEFNPFAALLQRNEDITEMTPAGLPVIPAYTLASMIRFDFTLLTNQRVVMEYAVRVRSNRSPNILHKEGLNAVVGELTAFAPADFVPPPPVDPAP